MKGAVNIPGKYALVEGLRLRELIENGKGLTFEAYMDRAFIIRTNKDGSKSYLPFNVKDLLENPQSEYNQELQEFDKVVIYENEQFVDNYYVEIFGAVRKKVKADFNSGMTLKNLIALAGGLKAQAANSNIEIQLLRFSPIIICNIFLLELKCDICSGIFYINWFICLSTS